MDCAYASACYLQKLVMSEDRRGRAKRAQNFHKRGVYRNPNNVGQHPAYPRQQGRGFKSDSLPRSLSYLPHITSSYFMQYINGYSFRWISFMYNSSPYRSLIQRSPQGSISIYHIVVYRSRNYPIKRKRRMMKGGIFLIPSPKWSGSYF